MSLGCAMVTGLKSALVTPPRVAVVVCLKGAVVASPRDAVVVRPREVPWWHLHGYAVLVRPKEVPQKGGDVGLLLRGSLWLFPSS